MINNSFGMFYRNFILLSNDSKLVNTSIMLLYNLCFNNLKYRLDVLKEVNIILKIMSHWTQNELEYR